MQVYGTGMVAAQPPRISGYAWEVHPLPGGEELVARGVSASRPRAAMLVELILLTENRAGHGVLTGPLGKTWECRLEADPDEKIRAYAKGRPRWKPGKP